MAVSDQQDDVASVANEGPLGKRRFLSMTSLVLLQTQNALNDNLARFLLVSLGAWWVTVQPGAMEVKHLLALLLLGPFILLSPLAGWLADRYRKNEVIRAMAWLQVVALGVMAVALWFELMWLSCAAFALLAAQSALLSPSKMGIVKELVGTRRLAVASGVMEMTVILAILAGQIFAGRWFDARLGGEVDGWGAAFLPVVIILAGCAFALLTAYGIQRTPRHDAPDLSMRVVFSHRREMRLLWADRQLTLVALGVGFFWGLAGLLNLLCIYVAEVNVGGGEGYGTELAKLMTAVSGGIAVGSVWAAWLSRRGIELGVVALGSIIMTGSLVFLALQDPAGGGFLAGLAATGVGGALMVVPLTAYLQEKSPANKRGSIMASSNILNNLFGVAGVVVQLALEKAGFGIAAQVWVIALMCGAVTVVTLRHLLADLLRMIIRRTLRIFFKLDIEGVEHLPQEGGAIVAPNHVGYLDALILSLTSERKIRFLVSDMVAAKWWARPAVSLFHAVPISSRRAKAAIVTAAETVAAGDLVGIYPEGTLTRTGMLNGAKPGVRLIAKKADAPIIPVYIDGLWGAPLSYSRGGRLRVWNWRLRRSIRVTFGPPMTAEHADGLYSELTRLGRKCWQRRDLRAAIARVAATGNEAWKKLDADAQRTLARNALQLSEISPVMKGRTLAVDLDNGGDAYFFRHVFAPIAGVKVVGREGLEVADGVLLDAAVAREREPAFAEQIIFAAVRTAEEETGNALPVFMRDGLVWLASVPDPKPIAGAELQLGNAEGSIGRALPGMEIRPTGAGIEIVTNSFEEETVQLVGISKTPNIKTALIS